MVSVLPYDSVIIHDKIAERFHGFISLCLVGFDLALEKFRPGGVKGGNLLWMILQKSRLFIAQHFGWNNWPKFQRWTVVGEVPFAAVDDKFRWGILHFVNNFIDLPLQKLG